MNRRSQRFFCIATVLELAQADHQSQPEIAEEMVHLPTQPRAWYPFPRPSAANTINTIAATLQILMVRVIDILLYPQASVEDVVIRGRRAILTKLAAHAVTPKQQ